MAHVFQFTRADGSKGTVKVKPREKGGVYLEIDRPEVDFDDEPFIIMLGKELARPVARAILEESE
jgi:hypothetical protein